MEFIQYLSDIDTSLMLWLNYDGGATLDQLWWIISGKFTWIPLYLYLIWILVRSCRPVKVRWRELTMLILLTVLVVVLSDQISSGIIKPLVMRPRPARPDSGISDLIHIVNDYRGGHYGFVSSHAANTWAIALWFMLLLKDNRQQTTDNRQKSPDLRAQLAWSLRNNRQKEGTNTSFLTPHSTFLTPNSTFLIPNYILLILFVLSNCYSRIYLGVHYPGDILGGLIVGTIVALFIYYMVYLPAKNGKLPFWKDFFESIFEGTVGSL